MGRKGEKEPRICIAALGAETGKTGCQPGRALVLKRGEAGEEEEGREEAKRRVPPPRHVAQRTKATEHHGQLPRQPETGCGEEESRDALLSERLWSSAALGERKEAAWAIKRTGLLFKHPAHTRPPPSACFSGSPPALAGQRGLWWSEQV